MYRTSLFPSQWSYASAHRPPLHGLLIVVIQCYQKLTTFHHLKAYCLPNGCSNLMQCPFQYVSDISMDHISDFTASKRFKLLTLQDFSFITKLPLACLWGLYQANISQNHIVTLFQHFILKAGKEILKEYQKVWFDQFFFGYIYP